MKQKIPKHKLPRIAFIGGESLGASHGTGMMMSRHFANYPKDKLIDINFQTLATGKSFFQEIHTPYQNLNYSSWEADWLKEINQRLQGKKVKGSSLLYKTRFYEPFRPDWKKFGGPPDLIYSTCFSMNDFSFLHHVYRNLPKKVPIIQHFLDLEFAEYHTMVSLFKELKPAMAELWALTMPIWYATSNFTDDKPDIVQALQQKLSADYKKTHREYSKDFRAVIIGNIWSGSAFKTICDVWSGCQKALPGLKPIVWYGHQRRFKELEHMNIHNFKEKSKIISDGGYLSQKQLNEALKNADLAIIAFSGEEIDREHYTRYSLPSRMGDYCALGLPIAVVGRKNSEPYRLVEEHKMGISADPVSMSNVITQVLTLIKSKELRAASGAKSRQFAEEHLDLDKYQQELYPRLIKAAQFKIPQKFIKNFK